MGLTDDDLATVYLAGPIRHLDDDGRTWRNALQEDQGAYYDFLNPLDLDDGLEIPEGGPVPLDVVGMDLDLCAQADVVLASLPFQTVSRGTAVEIWESGNRIGTPTVVWTDVHGDEFSPFVRDPADAIVQNLSAALDAVDAIHAGDDLNPDWIDFDGGQP